MHTRADLSLLLAVAVAASGCNVVDRLRDAGFDTLEKVGMERRELLVRRVDKARESQVDAKEEFADALEEFKALVGYDGAELEKAYRKAADAYDDADASAAEVRERIEKVDRVAESLFREWDAEIAEYRDPGYARESRAQLAETRRRTDAVLKAMRRASTRMEPVLDTLRDQVLYLKHNLNARALGSLDQTAAKLDTDVAGLVAAMQQSINEADAFIANMRQEPGPQ